MDSVTSDTGKQLPRSGVATLANADPSWWKERKSPVRMLNQEEINREYPQSLLDTWFTQEAWEKACTEEKAKFTLAKTEQSEFFDLDSCIWPNVKEVWSDSDDNDVTRWNRIPTSTGA